MSGAVIPQWKIALQQKLEKKKEEERRKLLEEEQRRLEALPPWKRMGMVPQNVIIISGGTKTVSKLSSDSDSTAGGEEVQKESRKSNTDQASKVTTNRTVSDSRISVKKSAMNAQPQENHVVSSQKESHLTNHVGGDEPDGAKMTPVTGREGVDEEHVASVSENPFLKLDGGARRRRASPLLKLDIKEKESTSKIVENKTTDSMIVVKKQPDNNIRQRSRSASPHRAAREQNVDLKAVEEDLPERRPRKNSVSDLRNKFGRAASIEDLRVVSRKASESESTSPLLSPRSPTALDRHKLFDDQPHKVHFNFTPDSSRKLAPASSSKVSMTSSVTSDKMPSTQPQAQKTAVTGSALSKPSETNSLTITEAGIAQISSTNRTTKRQAPKAPTASDSSASTKKDIAPTKAVTSSTSSSTSSAMKPLSKDLQKSNKPVESSKNVTMTNEVSLPDQPKTAILGDGQSSLRRKKGTSRMSASALISLSGDGTSDVQLSEHNARVRAARQEARASSSKNSLRSARDSESKDTDSIPKGLVSSNMFGSKLKTHDNKTPSSKPKEDPPYVDSIPYPENFRQPKKESGYVDTIPYPENFRQPKSTKPEASEIKAPTVQLKATSKTSTVEDIPRTNIDDMVLSPIKEDASQNLTNGSVETKAPPKKIKKKLEVEWIGYNTPTGKPSALKSSTSHKNEDKKMKISFNESSLSETYEYQSEESLLNEYLRKERGLNGNPRVGNLPRQEARDEEDEEDGIESSPASQSSIDNVLAHEGLQSYTPKDLQNFTPMSIRQQQQQQEVAKPQEETPPSPAEEPDPDDIAITYDDTGDYFSSAGSSSAALLF
ncbi:nucleolar and coiled-body phosphoprotein 1-like [Acanthaster planci]|uniref:Nucleolar and coiled-body phosphoprotein 1-like n=1 Tax=Acanthaster planci TaxID=133434 RepID=A0A8B7XZJ6_ACAPL|nr:nucleolar and coiled-body phosphoprotein 1-like [Acanthaster planci]